MQPKARLALRLAAVVTRLVATSTPAAVVLVALLDDAGGRSGRDGRAAISSEGLGGGGFCGNLSVSVRARMPSQALCAWRGLFFQVAKICQVVCQTVGDFYWSFLQN
jgi:hypothetical protein